MAAVAFAMILLPLVYLGLIACVGYATYRYAIDGTVMFEGRGNGQGKLILYLGPLVIGGLVVLFMVKPLFARRQKTAGPQEIKRDQAPELFTFIDQICDLVRAPRPTKVALDMQVNASASFRRGFLSLFRNDLTLTLGLPLVAGLTVRQFGGVLAHEFGHFAQGAGMRLTYVVRSINAWFARLVYERDAWDEYLRGLAGVDLRIGIVIHLARLMIWLTRKLLWVFMMAGHGISCFMLRQMEYDADYYETRVSGSDGFTETAGRLPLLGVAWQRVIAQQQECFEGKRLVDDLPSLIALETQRMPSTISEEIAKASREGKTGWFDTHPCDADRVCAAQRIGGSGILVGDEPASVLFGEFEQVTRPATEAYYREECEISLQDVQLLPLGTMAADAEKKIAEEKCLADVFCDLLSIRTLLFPSEAAVGAAAGVDHEIVRQNKERQGLLAEPAKASLKTLLEADNRMVLAVQARALLQAGFTIKKAEFQLPSASEAGVQTAIDSARQQIATQTGLLAESLQIISRRVELGIGALKEQAGSAEEFAEAKRLLTALGCFAGNASTIVQLRDHVAALELLLQNWGNAGSDTKLLNTARSTGASIQFSVTSLLQQVTGVRYPFEHAQGEIPLTTYLESCETHEEEAVRCFLRGQAVLGRFFSVYFRIMARLAALTKSGEDKLAHSAGMHEAAV
jgi:Zn-dependent protease with chaperone function